ncbi:MAG TPA: alpha/beta fold hydrolase [Actinomycetales bacterium]|nr:alpha/beta fold hydrolase [Actinomycetales bacterium]
MRNVTIPGRGTMAVWESDGPPGAPTLMLLHGLSMTAELGWSRVMARLAAHARVVAPDLRGHGDGVQSGDPFTLESCVDDISALASVLGIQQFVAVGYSMGGMAAQLLWRRHPLRVSGLVLCATARNVRGSPMEQAISMTLPAMAMATRWSPAGHLLTAQTLASSVLGHVPDDATRSWAELQLSRTSLADAVAAIHAAAHFNSRMWIGEVDVPTAVVITTRDTMVPPRRQRRLAQAVPGAVTVELVGDHGVCVTDPAAFGDALVEALHVVTGPRASERAGRAPAMPMPGASCAAG